MNNVQFHNVNGSFSVTLFDFIGVDIDQMPMSMLKKDVKVSISAATKFIYNVHPVFNDYGKVTGLEFKFKIPRISEKVNVVDVSLHHIDKFGRMFINLRYNILKTFVFKHECTEEVVGDSDLICADSRHYSWLYKTVGHYLKEVSKHFQLKKQLEDGIESMAKEMETATFMSKLYKRYKLKKLNRKLEKEESKYSSLLCWKEGE